MSVSVVVLMEMVTFSGIVLTLFLKRFVKYENG